MKVKYYFILVGLSVIAFIALMNYKPTPSVNSITRNSDGLPIITITKERSVEIIHHGEFTARAVGDNVAYICHYNGGEGNGGWDDVIPARNDPERSKFQPKSHPNKGVTSSFSLQKDSKLKSAQIVYTNGKP